jgi:hypothetical protein
VGSAVSITAEKALHGAVASITERRRISLLALRASSEVWGPHEPPSCHASALLQPHPPPRSPLAMSPCWRCCHPQTRGAACAAALRRCVGAAPCCVVAAPRASCCLLRPQHHRRSRRRCHGTWWHAVAGWPGLRPAVLVMSASHRLSVCAAEETGSAGAAMLLGVDGQMCSTGL